MITPVVCLQRALLSRAARGLVTVLATMTLLGCSQSLTPSDVAERFWRAVVAGQPAKMRRYVRQADRQQLDQNAEILPVATYSFGRVLIDGDNASIETRIVLDSDTPVPLNIETRLVREDELWRVDYETTVNEISAQSDLANVIGKIGAIGESLKRGIEQSVDEMNQALPAIEQELSRLESEIKQAMPELRDKLEAFSRKLEEALKMPPRQTPVPEQSPDSDPANGEVIAL